MPCRRMISFAVTPPCCSCRIATICSSVYFRPAVIGSPRPPGRSGPSDSTLAHSRGKRHPDGRRYPIQEVVLTRRESAGVVCDARYPAHPIVLKGIRAGVAAPVGGGHGLGILRAGRKVGSRTLVALRVSDRQHSSAPIVGVTRFRRSRLAAVQLAEGSVKVLLHQVPVYPDAVHLVVRCVKNFGTAPGIVVSDVCQ